MIFLNYKAKKESLGWLEMIAFDYAEFMLPVNVKTINWMWLQLLFIYFFSISSKRACEWVHVFQCMCSPCVWARTRVRASVCMRAVSVWQNISNSR